MGRISVLAITGQKDPKKNQPTFNRYQCTGKPEPLGENLAGYWSVRIDEKNRIVFQIDGNDLEILQCGTHYKDK